MEVLRIENEPIDQLKGKNAEIVVFDLGGGTYDVSVLEAGDCVCEVLFTDGDVHLGGDDFGKTIVDWVAKESQKKEGRD